MFAGDSAHATGIATDPQVLIGAWQPDEALL